MCQVAMPECRFLNTIADSQLLRSPQKAIRLNNRQQMQLVSTTTSPHTSHTSAKSTGSENSVTCRFFGRSKSFVRTPRQRVWRQEIFGAETEAEIRRERKGASPWAALSGSSARLRDATNALCQWRLLESRCVCHQWKEVWITHHSVYKTTLHMSLRKTVNIFVEP